MKSDSNVRSQEIRMRRKTTGDLSSLDPSLNQADNNLETSAAMSSSLRTAILVAVPTTIVSVCGIYYLRRRRKTNNALHRVVNAAANEIQSVTNSESRRESNNIERASANRSPCPDSTTTTTNILGAANQNNPQISVNDITKWEDFAGANGDIEGLVAVQSSSSSPPPRRDLSEIRDDLLANAVIDSLTTDLTHLSVGRGELSCNGSSSLSDEVSDSPALVQSTGSAVSDAKSFRDSECTSPASRPEFDQSIAYGDVLAWQQAASSCIDNGESNCFDAMEELIEFCTKEDESEERTQTGSNVEEASNSEIEVKIDNEASSQAPNLERPLWAESEESSAVTAAEVHGDSLSMVSVDSGQGDSNGPSTPTDSRVNSVPHIIRHEFYLPTQLVGILIGRQGRTVNGISKDSGAKIYVLQTTFDTELQSVYVDGTQKQVNDALDQIKKKLSRFPELNFDAVAPTSTEDDSQNFFAKLTLPEGMAVCVEVSSVVAADRIFVQQLQHPSFALLNYLNECMFAYYTQTLGEDLSIPLPIVLNTVCAAPMFGSWFRAQIIEYYAESDQCLIRFVDYGGYCLAGTQMLRQIRPDFLALPFQAVECFMWNVLPVSPDVDGIASDFAPEAKSFLESLVQSRQLLAEVVDYSGDGTPFVNLYQVLGNEMFSVNDELVAVGLARRHEQTDEEQQEQQQQQQEVAAGVVS